MDDCRRSRLATIRPQPGIYYQRLAVPASVDSSSQICVGAVLRPDPLRRAARQYSKVAAAGFPRGERGLPVGEAQVLPTADLRVFSPILAATYAKSRKPPGADSEGTGL